jgi:hypothetical protein
MVRLPNNKNPGWIILCCKQVCTTKYSLCFLILLHAHSALAQNGKIIDSLEKAAGNQQDTNLVKTYSELTLQYRLVGRRSENGKP